MRRQRNTAGGGRRLGAAMRGACGACCVPLIAWLTLVASGAAAAAAPPGAVAEARDPVLDSAPAGPAPAGEPPEPVAGKNAAVLDSAPAGPAPAGAPPEPVAGANAPVLDGAPADLAPAGASPATPPGLAPCSAAASLAALPSRAVGEVVRYVVDVDGISLGSVDFRIVHRGRFDGVAATEYRSLFRLDTLVASLVPVEGRSASLVPDAIGGGRAMNRYRLRDVAVVEELIFDADGRGLHGQIARDTKTTEVTRRLGAPVHDFVGAFYMLRALPVGASGCTLIYGHGRAYTLWVAPRGREEIKTPVGLRPADRVTVTYGSERSKQALVGDVWLGTDSARLPYRAELFGPQHLVAKVHLYEAGATP